MTTLPSVRPGNAIVITAGVTTPAGAAYSPSGGAKLTIIDSAGAVQLNAVAMAQTATGAYSYTFVVPSGATRGVWQGYVDSVDSGTPSGSPATALFIV